MSPFSLRRLVWLVTPLGLFLGCGKPSDQVPAKRRPNVVSAKELPALGDYLPPLDDRRIEVAPPEGWSLPPRSSKYLVRMQKSDRAIYPTILVTAEDYGGEGIRNVSDDNLEQFAGQVAAAANKDRSAVRPVKIGSFVGVTYGKRGRVHSPVTMILELICMETVVAGRKYHLELRSEDGSLEKDQPYLFAVAKGIKFLQSELAEAPKEEAQPEATEGPSKPEPPKAEAKEEPKKTKEGPKGEAKEKPKERPKRGDELELDLEELDDLLKK